MNSVVDEFIDVDDGVVAGKVDAGVVVKEQATPDGA